MILYMGNTLVRGKKFIVESQGIEQVMTYKRPTKEGYMFEDNENTVIVEMENIKEFQNRPSEPTVTKLNDIISAIKSSGISIEKSPGSNHQSNHKYYKVTVDGLTSHLEIRVIKDNVNRFKINKYELYMNGTKLVVYFAMSKYDFSRIGNIIRERMGNNEKQNS